ncbi:hypothetical protein LZ575_09180 [Antarcticibacterium sp. 1MA-6-2]|uniref:hypothetical protein n=1 Tax=Antarcticibacterium sp. 1MA-6-2 TaxID=2908210 RepID=UPI001F1AEBE4|nr:hypothetical protein [Antarcticibacterium sp. 1MA-6-2]UJH92620.1 hypothetical protein LZ575_09180 [Antarcticibacterium sp. 1MA-6-2]
MKKLALLFVFALTLSSCSIEDDGPGIKYEYAKIVDAGLPESFEKGKTYQLEITYLLPSACHSPIGIEAKRGNSTGDDRRKIFIVGISSINPEITECTVESDDLEREKTLTITIDEDEPYTFYLWDGLDAENESKYITVEVPVVAPGSVPATNE